MITFVDVNAWVYLANSSSPFHKKTVAHLEDFISGKKDFAISWQIFYEFIRVLTDPRSLQKPVPWHDACEFIQTIFKLPNAHILQEGPTHHDSIRGILKDTGYVRGHFIHDCHIAALIYEHGINRIISADQDFKRFEFLELVDPTV